MIPLVALLIAHLLGKVNHILAVMGSAPFACIIQPCEPEHHSIVPKGKAITYQDH
jgi:hypothetical protein